MKQFKEALKLALEFTWNYLLADSVRIDLYHFKQDDGGQGVDKEINGILKMGSEDKGF